MLRHRQWPLAIDIGPQGRVAVLLIGAQQVEDHRARDGVGLPAGIHGRPVHLVAKAGHGVHRELDLAIARTTLRQLRHIFRSQRQWFQVLDAWRDAEPADLRNAGAPFELLDVAKPLDELVRRRIEVHRRDVGHFLSDARAEAAHDGLAALQLPHVVRREAHPLGQ